MVLSGFHVESGTRSQKSSSWRNAFLIQVACVSLQCAITDVLLLPPSPPPFSKSSLPPTTGSPPLPDLLLCGDEGVVQRWGEEERGRGGWVKKWGAEVRIIFILREGQLKK